MKNIVITWQVEDGYCGGSRPHSTVVDGDDLQDYIDAGGDREHFISECVREDFENTISFAILGEEEE
jgi:hypothetical protein